MPLGELLGVILCKDKGEMLRIEKTTRKQFKAYRTSGEWFRLTTKISDYIQEYTDTLSGKIFYEEDKQKVLERQRERDREYRKDPQNRERQREYNREHRKDPEVRERDREYRREHRKDPEVRERDREYNRERRKDPEVRERDREHQREYRQRPEVRERDREYQRELRKTPEYKEYQRKYHRESYHRKKREKQSINGHQLTLFDKD